MREDGDAREAGRSREGITFEETCWKAPESSVRDVASVATR